MLDKVIAVYKQVGDVYFYIVGGHEENELILENTLETINETMNHLLRSQVDKRTILENYDYLLLAIDEIIDNGVIMETDHELVIKRVSLKNFDNDLPIGEQTITQALKTAKEKILENLAN
jgi:coatomer subunit zeta